MYFLRGTSKVVENEKELSEDTDWKCLYYGDNLEDVEGYFLISIENEKSEFNKYKHIEILGEDGTQHAYYFYHDWLPKNTWFRLWPIHEELVPYVEAKKIDKKPFDAKAYMAEVDAREGQVAACG